jgi:hypothetical protein
VEIAVIAVIADIADHRKAKAHRGGAETRRTAKVGEAEHPRGRRRHKELDGVTVDFQRPAFPLDPHFPCDYNIRVRILNVDKQAVSGVPELHWRQYEHHFVQRRAAPERPT